MAPRIALHLPREVKALHARAQAIWSAIQADPARFPAPYPTAAEVDADLAELGGAVQAAEGGDPIAITALRVAEDKVRRTLELLGKYVQSVVCAGPIEDAPAIISSVLMHASNVGRRSPKAELDARPGVTSGLVQLVALAVASAVAYYWEYSVDQASWTPGSQSAQARTTIVGLVPGKVYYFRFRAFRRDGVTTDYSQTVSFLVK